MKFALGTGVLGALILAQACGSTDPKRRSEPPDAGGASGGELAGVPAAGGTSGGDGAVAAGAPAGGVAGAAEGGAGAGATTEGGSASDGGTPGDGGASGVTCERAATCSGDLSALGTGDFSVAFS